MKKISALIILGLIAICCKQGVQTPEETTPIEEVVVTKEYPEAISQIFKAHGGITNWNTINQLQYTMDKGGDNNETHTVDLKNRNTRIEHPNYTIGRDGNGLWIAQDSTHFPVQRARFYHNLYFYFYAMPFVLGDDGITYTDVAPLSFDGKTYPGTKISYGAGVGDAPDDNYIIYLDPETNQMAWLAYTVTYGKNETSDKYSYIKYDQWQDVNGLQLPKTLQWYSVEDGKPVAMRNEQAFINVSTSEALFADGYFAMPENGTVVE